MELSDKYVVKEDLFNIVIYKKISVEKKIDGKPSGMFEEKLRCLGYYSPTVKGRVQAYGRVLNTEISESESQTLQEILDITKKTEKEIYKIFESKD